MESQRRRRRPRPHPERARRHHHYEDSCCTPGLIAFILIGILSLCVAGFLLWHFEVFAKTKTSRKRDPSEPQKRKTSSKNRKSNLGWSELQSELDRKRIILKQHVPQMDRRQCIANYKSQKSWQAAGKAAAAMFSNDPNAGDGNSYMRNVWTPAGSQIFNYRLGNCQVVECGGEAGSGLFSSDREISVGGVRMEYTESGGIIRSYKASMSVRARGFKSTINLAYSRKNGWFGIGVLGGTRVYEYTFDVGGSQFKITKTDASNRAQVLKGGSRVGDIICQHDDTLYRKWQKIENSPELKQIQSSSSGFHAGFELLRGNYWEAFKDSWRESNKKFEKSLDITDFEISLRTNLSTQERVMILAATVFLRETAGFRKQLYVKEEITWIR